MRVVICTKYYVYKIYTNTIQLTQESIFLFLFIYHQIISSLSHLLDDQLPYLIHREIRLLVHQNHFVPRLGATI